MLLTREEVDSAHCWDLNTMYSNTDAWDLDFQASDAKWVELQGYRNNLISSPLKLSQFLTDYLSLEKSLSTLYTFAHLKHDENTVNEINKTQYGRIMAKLQNFRIDFSWVEPELLSLPDNSISTYLSSPELASFRFYLEKIFRLKNHTLTGEKEALLALADKALSATHKAFSALNDADFRFGTILDAQKNQHELTHGSYGVFQRSPDRVLRENAFNTLHEKYLDHENALCELLQGQAQKHLFSAKARHYSSCLEAALYPDNINTSVYHSLIQAVHEHLPSLHRYLRLRSKVLNIPKLQPFDLNVPLLPNLDLRIPYSQAENLIIDSVRPLGNDYQNILRKGLQEQRWVDRFENKNKRSGAYSSGCYGSMPYILMNYKEILRDVFTLAHEAGHSMHSFLSNTHQPYHYSSYSIFLAEVASTFHEELLTKLLLEQAKSNEAKAYLINQKIEDIRATLFRQTLFAEFELTIHQWVENDTPFTPQALKTLYHQLNQKYFGECVEITPLLDIEWARIPHFYYNFYVYQYATGISAALSLSKRVTEGSSKEKEDYISFLQSGSSQYPIEVLKNAGVNMESTDPIISAIKIFDSYVTQLESLI